MSVLNKTDLQSAAWLKLREYITGRIEQLRRKNDTDLSKRDTHKLRGQIAELKMILGIESPPPKFQQENDSKFD